MYRPLGRLQHLAEGPRPASGEELDDDELALDGAVAARGLPERVDRRAERVLDGVAADLRRSPIRTHAPTRSWSPAGESSRLARGSSASGGGRRPGGGSVAGHVTWTP